MGFGDNLLLDDVAKTAVELHRGQVRKSFGIPYVTHCFDVMKRVASYGVTDDKILAASLLHDVIEDCGVDKQSLALLYGIDVVHMVVHCTRPADQKTKEQKIEWLGGFGEKTIGSIVIKIADRYCNVTDYLTAGNTKYAMLYNLQAYPLYATYFKREHEVPEEWRAGIRGDIYAYNQKMQAVLGHSLQYLETEHYEDSFFKFDREAVNALLFKKKKVSEV